MNLNTKQIVSISEANQNFSRVARMTDKQACLYDMNRDNTPAHKKLIFLGQRIFTVCLQKYLILG